MNKFFFCLDLAEQNGAPNINLLGGSKEKETVNTFISQKKQLDLINESVGSNRTKQNLINAFSVLSKYNWISSENSQLCQNNIRFPPKKNLGLSKQNWIASSSQKLSKKMDFITKFSSSVKTKSDIIKYFLDLQNNSEGASFEGCFNGIFKKCIYILLVWNSLSNCRQKHKHLMNSKVCKHR